VSEANIVMGAESPDFFFYCWYLKVLTDDVQGASTISRKTLDLKRSKISV
jgi:hypothetical protein